eukprot:11260858-Alexandrium_andersonii.AAC.1
MTTLSAAIRGHSAGKVPGRKPPYSRAEMCHWLFVSSWVPERSVCAHPRWTKAATQDRLRAPGRENRAGHRAWH